MRMQLMIQNDPLVAENTTERKTTENASIWFSLSDILQDPSLLLTALWAKTDPYRKRCQGKSMMVPQRETFQ